MARADPRRTGQVDAEGGEGGLGGGAGGGTETGLAGKRQRLLPTTTVTILTAHSAIGFAER
jgi:hypothetical protein